MENQHTKTPNNLINESSPYLLQHAYNPVNWLPYGANAFEKARRENKMVLISVGYSACHWCHVMEHESFEDEEVAALMNAHFVSVKVDREERSDVDMLYMQAVQLMTGQGGWPLNCFVLPDGRPFYGGTYFRKDHWMNILRNLAHIYENDREKVMAYATELTAGIKQSEELVSRPKEDSVISAELLELTVNKWKERMDNENGGPNRAPKFPLPSNYQFLLRYALLQNDSLLLEHVNLTLTKMAFGGINDQLHGGFARYSTDMIWKVPHFEKMLYDNAQLASLYIEAFLSTGNGLYKQVACDTLGFVAQEWYTGEGAFYSALDADSDGEEGKFYVWNKEDLKEVLGDDYNLFSSYYKINDEGCWEHGNYILMRNEKVTEVMLNFNLNQTQLEERIEACKNKLKQEVKSRLKPGLDDKVITSWNAMMCSAYARAAMAFDDNGYRDICLRSIHFMLQHLQRADGGLYRTYKNGTAKIHAFLEDYVFLVEALIQVYLLTKEDSYLLKAEQYTNYALKNFQNPHSPYLFYTDEQAESLLARTTEVSDNVVPSSNSQMALNLFLLSKYSGKLDWERKAVTMLHNVATDMPGYGSGYSNWGCLALHLIFPFREVVIVGNNVNEKFRALYQHGLTNTIFAVSDSQSDRPLLRNRFVEGKTWIYVCENNTCSLPVETVDEALQQLA